MATFYMIHGCVEKSHNLAFSCLKTGQETIEAATSRLKIGEETIKAEAMAAAGGGLCQSALRPRQRELIQKKEGVVCVWADLPAYMGTP